MKNVYANRSDVTMYYIFKIVVSKIIVLGDKIESCVLLVRSTFLPVLCVHHEHYC